MNTFRTGAHWITFLIGLIIVPIVWSQGEDSNAEATDTESNASSVSAADLRILEQFLSLSDDDLARIQALIQKIRDMSPEEKEAYKAKVREFHRMDPGKRSAIRKGWGRVSEEMRRGWMEMMHGLPDEERMRIHNQMLEMGPEERIAYREKLVKAYLRNKNAK